MFYVAGVLENGNSIPAAIVHQNGDSLDTTTSEESNQGGNIATNGKSAPLLDEDTNTSFADHSSPTSIDAEETNDSVVSDSTNDSMAHPDYKRPLDDDDSNSLESSNKKLRGEDK